jgi:hypothetical protein
VTGPHPVPVHGGPVAPPTLPASRLIRPDDAAALAGLARENRDNLAPFEPERAESYYTEDGQAALVVDLLRATRGAPPSLTWSSAPPARSRGG